MSIELIGANIQKQKQIVANISNLFNEPVRSKKEARNVQEHIGNSFSQLKILNNALPDLVDNIRFYPNFSQNHSSESAESRNVVRVGFESGEDKQEFGISKKDKSQFLSDLTREKQLQKEKEKLVLKEKEEFGSKMLKSYIRISNSFFKNFSLNLAQKRQFDSLNEDLRKISSSFILSSYLSLMFFSTSLAFVIGIIVFIGMIFFNVLLGVLFLFGLPILVFSFFYIYPMSERMSLSRTINNELPFATIYMAAISNSGIESTKIFEILLKTKDYPSTQREVKRLLNYINFYGYDLSTALREVARKTPSVRLSVLFNGLATTIRSGGELSEFFKKHAETLLFDYKLEREKYTKIAETFMDIYISILIAAPMIMMVLLILIGLTGYSSTFASAGLLTTLVILIVIVLNILFLVVLSLKQPKF